MSRRILPYLLAISAFGVGQPPACAQFGSLGWPGPSIGAGLSISQAPWPTLPSGIGSSISARNSSTQTAEDPEARDLVVAAASGDLRWMKRFLREGADVDKPARAGSETPLYAAAAQGRTRAMQLLFRHSASVDARGPFGETPLMAAASRGKPRDLRVLLHHGADIEARDAEGHTALFHAALASLPNLRYLLEHHAKVDALDKARQTPLFAAVRGGPEAVKLLLKHGLRADATDVSGNTALGNLAWAGELEAQTEKAAAYLFSLGTPLQGQLRKPGARTPLFTAVQSTNVEMVRLLLRYGADPNEAVQGMNPLWTDIAREAIIYSSFDFPDRKRITQVARLLLESGANPDAAPAASAPPVMLAVRARNLTVLRLLLQHGADPNVKESDGVTPLFLAQAGRQQEMVELLTAHGARP